MSSSDSSRARFEASKETMRERARAGVQLQLDGEEKSLKRERGFKELFKAFWALLGQERRPIVGVLALMTVSTVLGLAPLYAPKLVLDNVVDGRPLPGVLEPSLGALTARGQLFWILGVSLSLTVLALLVGLVGRWIATRAAKRVAIDVRGEAFEHASRLPLHRLTSMSSGGTSSLLRDDAGAPAALIGEMLLNPWGALVQLTGSVIMLLIVDARLVLAAVALVPIIWITHRTWIRRIRPMWRETRKIRREVDGHTTQVFGGIRIVRAFGRRRSEATRYVRGQAHQTRFELLAWWWMRGVDTAWAIAIPASTAALLCYGALRIIGDAALLESGQMQPGQELTIGSLVLFLTYLTAMLGPLATLAATATGLQNSLAGLDRVLDLFAEEEDMPTPADAVELDLESVVGAIKLEGVSFTYPGTETPALADLELDVAAGTTVALVGPSGAGKTTLCNLIARFFDPTAGTVTLDGTDLKRIPVDDYRRALALVEQDVFLFDASIGENVAYSRRDASKAEIRRALERANALEFVDKLPEGLDARIGERGVKLSGGQRQRLAIARALLAEPRLLILDEATSSLDTENELLIQASLSELMRGRTSFVIAHRLSTIRQADLILVIDAGRIVERGTHEELIEAGGVYQGMVAMQTQRGPEP